MKRILPVASWPAPARSKESRGVAICVAIIFLVMVLTQLFTFEDFVPLFAGFGDSAVLLPVVIVAAEVAALPFLLRMKLSRLARAASMMAGWVVVTLWLFVVAGALMLPRIAMVSTGILGGSVAVPVAWWVVAFLAALSVLVIWASWGLWPESRSRAA